MGLSAQGCVSQMVSWALNSWSCFVFLGCIFGNILTLVHSHVTENRHTFQQVTIHSEKPLVTACLISDMLWGVCVCVCVYLIP